MTHITLGIPSRTAFSMMRHPRICGHITRCYFIYLSVTKSRRMLKSATSATWQTRLYLYRPHM